MLPQQGTIARAGLHHDLRESLRYNGPRAIDETGCTDRGSIEPHLRDHLVELLFDRPELGHGLVRELD